MKIATHSGLDPGQTSNLVPQIRGLVTVAVSVKGVCRRCKQHRPGPNNAVAIQKKVRGRIVQPSPTTPRLELTPTGGHGVRRLLSTERIDVRTPHGTDHPEAANDAYGCEPARSSRRQRLQRGASSATVIELVRVVNDATGVAVMFASVASPVQSGRRDRSSVMHGAVRPDPSADLVPVSCNRTPRCLRRAVTEAVPLPLTCREPGVLVERR